METLNNPETATTRTVTITNTTDLVAVANAWPERARAMIIADAPQAAEAAKMLNEIQAMMKQADYAFDPEITKRHAAHKEAIREKALVVDPLNKAKTILRNLLASWQNTERLRLEAIERARLEEQARQRAELEAMRQRAIEDERALARAAQAEAAGNAEAAEEIIEEQLTTPTLPVIPEPVTVQPRVEVRVTGASFREVWTAEVSSGTALLAYLNTEAPDALRLRAAAIEGALPLLNRLARERKSTLDIPGVKAVCGTTAVSR